MTFIFNVGHVCPVMEITSCIQHSEFYYNTHYTVYLKYVFIAHFFVIFTEGAAGTALLDDKDARATQEDKTW
jgi:hypothetical protein